ncbi:MAG: hypothetical protein KatS3mg003_0357 [Candidatus Nitrosocaldaceae archaeon]|nr:MAG: hypothetical protein KatS3mg003_0357 [Candidatus Nitrosocaldaceae archaeon]
MKSLSKILKNSHNYLIGSKEVLKNIEKAKIVIYADTLEPKIKEKAESICKDRSIPIYNSNNTSLELGRLCNKPFRVSILALTDIDDNDLQMLLKEINNN